MKKSLFAVFVALLSLGLTIGSAEAARLGGGKSTGMQRQAVAQKPAATPAQATPATPAAAAPKRNWMGPLAGLAAGLGIAALLSHFGMGEGMANFLMIALLAMAAIFIVKMFLRRKAQPASDPMQYAGVGGAHMAPAPQAEQPFGSMAPATAPVAAVETARSIPAGFDVEGFLRIAKLNFIRLQASNDAKNIDDIREFVGPELFAEIKMQMDERGNAAQQTDVAKLDAELLEVVTEGPQHIASVRFSGMISEVAGTPAAPFDEVWNLTKAVDGSKGWTVSGIQQLG